MHTKATLDSLCQATLRIAAREDVDDILQNIVDEARDLLDAEYAALGVPNAMGLLDEFIVSGIDPADAAMMAHLPKGLGLLGAIIKENKPIRINRIQDDPRSVGFPANHPSMTSFLGVPIVSGTETIGNLYICNKRDTIKFTQEDEDLAVLFAAHAAVAIHNDQLDQEIQRLAILDERTRIGMDLHDGIIQSIYAVGLTLESTRLTMENDADEAKFLLDHAITGLNDAIQDIRNFILDLRPRRYSGDLNAALQQLAREFRANTMVDIKLDLPKQPIAALPPRVGRTLFLCAQNALANVARHAHAERVWVVVESTDNNISLAVRDNGRGFNAAERESSIGHGLHNMKARSEKLDGTFNLTSAPGEGTEIAISLPFA